jgi:tetratricopeptide (TPR) repeat protein
MKIFTLITAFLLFFSQGAWSGMDEDIARVRLEWERIKYQLPVKEQEAAFEKLVKDSEKIAAQYSNRAEPAIWHGIIVASFAGAKGGIGALSLAKDAKKTLEQALVIDPNALDGSAYLSLGSLYYQVPGWPLGFGDDKKARELLQKALALNPNGIDSNYFYGDFLYRMRDYAGAEQSLRKALQAPAREGRKIADDGRRQEIATLLEKIREKR